MDSTREDTTNFDQLKKNNQGIEDWAQVKPAANYTCLDCPSCLTCDEGQHPKVKGGYQQRDYPATADPIARLITEKLSTSIIPVTRVYPCPGVHSIGRDCSDGPSDGSKCSCRGLNLSSLSEQTAEKLSNETCNFHTSGKLCAICRQGFFRDRSGVCSSCDRSAYRSANLAAAMMVIALILILGCVIPRVRRCNRKGGPVRDLRIAVSNYVIYASLYSNVKILLSSGQILGNIERVLNVKFSPPFSDILDFFRWVVVVDLRTYLATDCWAACSDGASDGNSHRKQTCFYWEWIGTVYALPVVMILAVLAWHWMQPASPTQNDRTRSLRERLFFVVLLVYPVVSHRAFELFECRDVADIKLLVSNMAVQCDSIEFEVLRWGGAGIALLLIPLGVPFVSWITLRRQYGRLQAEQEDETKRKELLDAQVGFLTQDYKVDCYYFEVIQFVRKLILTGGLLLFRRGSREEAFAGAITSFFFFGLFFHL
jgi:hypothetical protein